jgi:MtN3 and saliva related transmembrane protein
MNINIIAQVLGYIAGLLTTSSFFFQAWKSKKKGEVASLSLETFLLQTASTVCWIAYGTLIGQFPILLWNIGSGVGVLWIVFLIFKYGKPKVNIALWGGALLGIAAICVFSILVEKEVVGYAAAAIGLFVYFPQAVKTVKTKNTKDISRPMYSIFWVGTLLWLIYGILIVNWPSIIVNAVIISLATIILRNKIKYG